MVNFKKDAGMRAGVKMLSSLFSKIPPSWKDIEALLCCEKYSPEELAYLANEIAEIGFCEYADALNEEVKEISLGHMHSDYIIQSLKRLLNHGLDPNIIIGDDNVLWSLQWVDMPNVAAGAMRLLLEHGGDPNHCISAEDETLFEYIDFKVSYDEYTHDYFPTVQCWLVLMAYGAHYRDGGIPLTMLNGNSVSIFKDFELFDYEIEPLPQEPGYYGCWIMHIFNKQTKEEVASYK